MILNTQPRTFVITLMDHPVSLPQADVCVQSANKWGWRNVQLFPATDGKKLTLDSWNTIGIKPLLDKPGMNKLGHWGCFFSHWRLWNICVTLNEPIVILEHDAIIHSPWVPLDISNAIVKLHRDTTKEVPHLWVDPLTGQSTGSTLAYCMLPEHAVKLINFCKAHGAFATDRLMGNKVIDVVHVAPTLVEGHHSYSTTENL
jgi:hypothetical protein